MQFLTISNLPIQGVKYGTVLVGGHPIPPTINVLNIVMLQIESIFETNFIFFFQIVSETSYRSTIYMNVAKAARFKTYMIEARNSVGVNREPVILNRGKDSTL